MRALAEAELPFLLVQPEDFPKPSGNRGSYYMKADHLALGELFALHKYSVNGETAHLRNTLGFTWSEVY